MSLVFLSLRGRPNDRAIICWLVCLAAGKYVELTPEAISDYVGGPAGIFIKFYSPSCGHYHSMAGDFDEAASKLPDFPFGGVDCAAAPRSATRTASPAFRC
jgi:hypothetical protein